MARHASVRQAGPVRPCQQWLGISTVLSYLRLLRVRRMINVFVNFAVKFHAIAEKTAKNRCGIPFAARCNTPCYGPFIASLFVRRRPHTVMSFPNIYHVLMRLLKGNTKLIRIRSQWSRGLHVWLRHWKPQDRTVLQTSSAFFTKITAIYDFAVRAAHLLLFLDPLSFPSSVGR